MKTRLLKTPDLPSQSLGWASNTPQHLRIAGHWVSSHVGYSACGNQMLLRPEFDSSKAHFRPTPSNGAGFRAMGRQKPRYTGC